MWIGPYASQMFLKTCIPFRISEISYFAFNKHIYHQIPFFIFILKSSLPLGNHLNRDFEQMFTTVHPLQLISTEHMCVNEKLKWKWLSGQMGERWCFLAVVCYFSRRNDTYRWVQIETIFVQLAFILTFFLSVFLLWHVKQQKLIGTFLSLAVIEAAE